MQGHNQSAPPTRVLIVDDEKAILDLLARLVASLGVEVNCVDNGPEALRLMEQHLHNLVILDLRMPGMDGLQVLERVKKIHPDCEVIILTGYGDMQSAVQAMRYGAYDYLQKPVEDIDLFLSAVRRALEKQRLSVERQELIRDLQEAQQRLSQQRANELNHIRRIGLALGSALERDDIVRVTHDAIESLVGCEVLGFWIVGPDLGDREFRLHSYRPLSQDAIERLQQEIQSWLAADGRLLRQAGDLPVRVICDSEGGEDMLIQALNFIEIMPVTLRDRLQGLVLIASQQVREFSADEKQLLDILIAQAAAALEKTNLFRRMSDLAIRDGLTNLFNYRHFYELLHVEAKRVERYGGQFSVVMIDTDILKTINDTYGHPAGDDVLRQISHRIRSLVRASDIVARYGGDEFALILPHTGSADAAILAERLRRAIAEYDFTCQGEHLQVTISLGVATFVSGKGMTAEDVVVNADRALYMAKANGGNQVRVYPTNASS